MSPGMTTRCSCGAPTVPIALCVGCRLKVSDEIARLREELELRREGERQAVIRQGQLLGELDALREENERLRTELTQARNGEAALVDEANALQREVAALRAVAKAAREAMGYHANVAEEHLASVRLSMALDALDKPAKPQNPSVAETAKPEPSRITYPADDLGKPVESE